jgi:transcription initiation factor TFIIIB Brf1 subunit/transcription initiation factor TFIIB
METITCPYCETKVRVGDVETDDGTCPECGAPLMGSLIFDNVHDDDDDPYEEGEGHLAALENDDVDDVDDVDDDDL